jgi:hypothetical protein
MLHDGAASSCMSNRGYAGPSGVRTALKFGPSRQKRSPNLGRACTPSPFALECDRQLSLSLSAVLARGLLTGQGHGCHRDAHDALQAGRKWRHAGCRMQPAGCRRVLRLV